MSDLVRVVPRDAGALWQVTFGTGDGNILDRATMRELARVFVDARAASDLKAICLEGAGRDFSFGASVQEHQIDHVQSMLEALRGLALDLLDCHVTTIAAVRGRCLGGGLELVAICHRAFATTDAKFGQPENRARCFPAARIDRAPGTRRTRAGRSTVSVRQDDGGGRSARHWSRG
jgi:enoyl-CoA hydratase/carnithine racemase